MSRTMTLRTTLLAATALTAALAPLPASADVTVVGGTTFDIGGGTVFHNNLFLDDGNLTNGTFNASVVFDVRRGTIDANLTGAADFTKNSGNTVTLSGTNTYTGFTSVNDGTLIVVGGLALPDLTAVTIGGPGLLQVEDSETVGSLSGSGTLLLNGTSVFTTGGSNTSTTFAGLITGDGGLTKVGSGTLTLTNANDYFGDTTINGGTLKLSGSGQAGALGLSKITVNDGAILDITNTSQLVDVLTLNDNATVNNDALGAGNVNFNALDVTTASGKTATIFAPISGTGTITKDGAGTFVVAGFPNFGYSGTVDLNAGTLQLIWSDALGSGNVNMNGPSTLSLNNSTGNGQNFFNTITLAGSGAAIDVSNGVSVQWGAIGESGGVRGLTKTGGGILALGGNNTFTGLTSIQEGMIYLGWADSAQGALAGPIDIAAASGLVIWRSGTLTLPGDISGDGTISLEPGNTGTTTLSGNNTYTGNTFIDGGTLAASGGNGFSDVGTLFIGDNGTARIDNDETIGSLSGTGSFVLNNSILTIDSGSYSAFDGVMSGTGGVTLANVSQLNLSAVQTYTGLTTLSDSQMVLNGAANLAGNVSILGVDATLTFADTAPSTTRLYNGNISGDGNLRINVGPTVGANLFNIGVIEFSGANTLTGLTTIEKGRLQIIGSGSISGDVSVLGTNDTAWLDFDQTGTLTYGGVISGENASYGGGGTTILTGVNTHNYNGIAQGTLKIGTGGVIGNANSQVWLSGIGSGAVLDLGGTTQTVSVLRNFSGYTNSVINGTLNVSSQIALQNGTVSANLTGLAALNKSAPDITILSGTNSFSGGTNIFDGTLVLQGSNALSDLGTVDLLSADAALQLDANETIGSLASNSNGIVDLGAHTLTLGGNNLNTTASVTMLGDATSSLVKTGLGTSSFLGGLGHLGTTVVNGGELHVDGNVAGSVIVNAAGRYSGSSTINGNLTVLGTLATGNSPGTTTVLGNYTGGGVLEVDVQFDNAGAPVNGVTHDFLDISGNVTGSPTSINLLAFLPSGSPAATTGNGIQLVRVGGSTSAADFTMSSYLLGSYFYDVAYLQDYSGTDDGFFLQSSLATPGCSVSTGDDACFIDATTPITPVDALAGHDTLQLTGSTNFSFNVGNVGTTYTNFEAFQKAGTSVVTLTGTTSDSSLGIDVQNGTLIAGTNQLGALGTVNVFTPGILQVSSNLTIGSIAGSGEVNLLGNLTAGATNASTSFSGLFSGSGKLVKDGTGLLTLSGTNTFTGGIDILHGGIRLLSSGAAGTGPITTFGSVISYGNAVNNAAPIILSSNTTQLEVLNTDTATQSGAISEVGGSRPIEKIGTGTLTLSGVNTYTGLTTISAGTLAVQGGNAIANSAGVTTAGAGTFSLATSETIGSFAGSGSLLLGSGTVLTTGGNNASTTFSGTSSGQGGLTKTGTGVFTLTGANAFTGPLSVAAGNLSVVSGGSLTGASSFSVLGGAQAFLGSNVQGVNGAGMTGTGIGSLSVNSGGTVYLDDNTTLSVASANLSTGSNLNLFLTTNTSQYGKINASGTASVAGANVGVYLDPITFSGTLLNSFTYNNVVTGSSVAGTFGSVSLLQTPSPLFTVTGIYSGTSAGVQVTRNAFSTLGGNGNNQGNVGDGLEVIFVNGTTDPDLLNLFNVIGNAPAGAIPAIYAAVAGAENSENTGAGLRTDDPWKQSVAERVNAARTTGCTVSGDSWCLRRYAQASTNGGEVMSDIQGDPTAFDWLETGIRDAGTTSFWARGIGAWGETKGDIEGPGSRQWTGGLIGGVDRVFDSLFLAGIAAQYVETDVNYDASPNKSLIRSGQVGAYASYGGAEAYVNGNISLIGSQASASRYMNIGLLSYNVESLARSWALTASVEGGTIMEFDGYRFEPSLALNYQGAFPESFEEHGGGGLSLIVNPEHSDSLRSILSARVSRVFDIGDRKLVPQLRLDWRHEMLDRRQTFSAAFAGAPTVSFDVEGATYARDVIATGASVTMPITGQITGYVDAQGAFSEDSTSVMVSLGGRATW